MLTMIIDLNKKGELSWAEYFYYQKHLALIAKKTLIHHSTLCVTLYCKNQRNQRNQRGQILTSYIKVLADKSCFLPRPSTNLTFNTLPRHHALKISNWWVMHFSWMKWKPCLHMDVLSWRLRSHQLCIEGSSVMLGWRWEVTNNRSAASQYEEVKAWMPTVTQLQGWITCSRVKFKNL